MASAVADPAVSPGEPTLRERVVDTARHVAHLSHEARMLTSVASDAVEDGVYKARRAVKTATRELADARDETVYRIKRDPLRSVGVALGVGVCIGLASGLCAWLVARSTRRTQA